MIIKCPNCSKKLSVPEEYKGKKVKCLSCGHILLIVVEEKFSLQPPLPQQPKLETTAAQSKEKSCANCSKKLGKLEQSLFYKDNLVCVTCYNVLTTNVVQEQKQKTIQLSVSAIKSICGILGSVLLAIGVFLPIVKMPIIGYINYFRYSQIEGELILILACSVLLFTLAKGYAMLWLFAFGSAGLIIHTLVKLIEAINEARSSVGRDLADDIFSALTGTIQLEYGCIILAIGVVCTIVAAAIPADTQNIDNGISK